MSLDEQFNTAAQAVRGMPEPLPEAELLQIYGLYKQATEGDVNKERPGLTDMKGKAKWDAWNSLKGTDQSEAKAKYVEKVNTLKSNIRS